MKYVSVRTRIHKLITNPRMELEGGWNQSSRMRPQLPLTSLGKQLDSGEHAFGALKSSADALGDLAELRRRMDEDGYLLLPKLLLEEEVRAARRHILGELQSEGLLNTQFAVEEAVAAPTAQTYFRPDLALRNEPLQRLLYRVDGPLMSFFTAFLEGPVRHFDFTWLRCVAPKAGTPPHADVVYMGRGTKRLFTAWTPLSNIDLDMGGLMILEGSHRNQRLLQGYCQRDVDSYCENRPDDTARTANGLNGWLTSDPVKVQRGLKGRWLTAPYHLGDVLIFNMYLVHGALDNRSTRFRLSSDSRYQLASEPVDERWVGANPVGHSLAGKRGRIC